MRLLDRANKRVPDGVAVSDLPTPATGNRIYYDAAVKGFGVRVTAKGARAWILNYRAGGRERRVTIGAHPDWSAEAARAEAKELKKRIDRGEDPMAERHGARAAPTVADLIRRYKEAELPKKRPSTQRNYEALLDNYTKKELGAKKVASVKHADIEALHRSISKRAPYQANRCAAILSKLWNYAIKLEWAMANPVKGLERNAEERRTRFLSGGELAALSKALAESREKTTADAIRLLLLSGARRGEALSATWDQFDLEGGVWTKPSAHTKQKKEHRVPLSAPALALLRELDAAAREKKPRPRYVFPGRKEGAHLEEPKKSWAVIRERATVHLWAEKPVTPAGAIVAALREGKEDRALPSYAEVAGAAAKAGVELPPGLTDVRLHDLRHTYASILASAGLSLPIIGALLGHTQAQTTARYAHLMDDPLRAATERVGAVVTAAGAAPAEVIPLRRG